jgi:hypothetical protein
LQDFYQRREQNCSRPAAFKNATVRERPTPAGGDFPVDWRVYFVSRRSLKLSRKTEFGATGHCRISTSDVSKIAADRPLSKMRQCANDPERSCLEADDSP